LDQTSAEWKLDKRIFQNMCQMLRSCQVDLFASHLNNQLDQYVSWRPDLFAIANDALQISWIPLEGYAFPPFALVGWCLQMIKTERCTVPLAGRLNPGFQLCWNCWWISQSFSLNTGTF